MRTSKAIESIQQGLTEITYLRDAYQETADLLRRVANGDPTAPADANHILREHIKRGFLHSTFYIPLQSTPPEAHPIAALVLRLLNDTLPPPGTLEISDIGWENISDVRRKLATMCQANLDKTEAAVVKPALRPWFSTKLFQQDVNHQTAITLVTQVFAAAARQACRA